MPCGLVMVAGLTRLGGGRGGAWISWITEYHLTRGRILLCVPDPLCWFRRSCHQICIRSCWGHGHWTHYAAVTGGNQRPILEAVGLPGKPSRSILEGAPHTAGHAHLTRLASQQCQSGPTWSRRARSEELKMIIRFSCQCQSEATWSKRRE